MDRIAYLHQKELERLEIHEDMSSGKPALKLADDPAIMSLSFMLRKARMVEETLKQVEVRILPRELIVGTFLKTWIVADYTTYEERLQYADMNLAYPRRNNIYTENGEKIYSSSPLRLSEEELQNPYIVGWSWGHACGGFERILQMGYLGIAEEAERKISEMKQGTAADQEKIEFWQAVSICSRAVCRLSDRYADTLEKMALEEADLAQKAEYKQLAAMMRRVPARPAESFWDAVQSVWFSWMCSSRFNGTDLGRLDQYLYPYYEKDLEKGLITEDKAQELVSCFFLKCFESYISVSVYNKGTHPAVMLGGRKHDGTDGTNPLTMMCLKAAERFASPTPKVSVRVNKDTPKAILEQAHKMLMKGLNQPDFYADDNIISAYERIGVPYEDAVSYAQSTCEENSLAGISEDCTNEGPHCDVHDKVELAMRRVCAGEKADTFEAFMQLVEEEIRLCLLEEMEYHNEQTKKLAFFSPQPLHSAGIVGCLESGKDITAGGAKYNNTGSVIGGLATAADGLYAIRRLVYEEKRLTLPEFHEILKNDFGSHELLRQEILNKFPKFGNDIEEVDEIATRLFAVFSDELEKHKNCRGGVYKIGAWASEYRSAYPATPDGRKKGDTYATNISPTPGKDLKGATAILRSAASVNLRHCTAGGMVDVAMHPSCIRGEMGPEILRQLVMGYADMGGIGVQFNILDAEVLKEAQKNPAKYRSLMVRVWGYNDYFVSLDDECQQHIIARTIQETL